MSQLVPDSYTGKRNESGASMKRDDGGSAFPEIETGTQWCGERQGYFDHTYSYGGMTLRDYLAAKALPACYAQVCDHCEQQGWPEDWRAGVASDAYRMADEMLKARKA